MFAWRDQYLSYNGPAAAAGSSLYMPKNTSGNQARVYTTSPGASLASWYSTSWTMEFWIYVPNMSNLPAYNSNTQFSGPGNHNGAGTYYWFAYVIQDGRVGFYAYPIGNITSATGTITAGAWYSIAIVNTKGANNSMVIYVNGNSVASASWSNGQSNSGYWSIGPVVNTTVPSAEYYLDELRVSNVARYSANYTPATSQFSSDANTLLLMHFTGANGSTTFTDSGPSSITFTETSSTPLATISTAQSKF